MDRIELITMQWNTYNGFVFVILDIELSYYNHRALFGINSSKNYLYIDIFFKEIKVFDKTK